ncbi:hypothetical protein ABT364_19055 [Massilia sp. SR12]
MTDAVPVIWFFDFDSSYWHLGDLGRASSFGMLAVALAQAQGKQAPVLCAEFAEADSVALAFTVPQPTT